MKMRLVTALIFAVIVAIVVAMQGDIALAPEGMVYTGLAALFGFIVAGKSGKKRSKSGWQDESWDDDYDNDGGDDGGDDD